MGLLRDRVLPSLENNIKSGNSLIDTDIYDQELDFGEERKIKPFSWQNAFPQVFENGGFDAVIGNPPYVMLQNLDNRITFDYATKKYVSATYKIDTYQLFTEKGIFLLKDKGALGYIIPNTFLKNIHSEPLRRFLLSKTTIDELIVFTYPVFESVSVDTSILILRNLRSNKKSNITVKVIQKGFKEESIKQINQNQFESNKKADFNIFSNSEDVDLLHKIISKSKLLGKYCNAYFGIQTYDRKKFVSTIKLSSSYEPVIDGANIDSYLYKGSTEFINFVPSSIKSGGNEKVYRQSRICIRQIGAYPIATIVGENIFTLNTIYNVFLKEFEEISLKYLLGLINSNLVRFYWKKQNSDAKKVFPKIKKEAILSIPIFTITSAGNQKNIQQEIIKNVELLLQLNQELYTTNLQTKKEQLQQRIQYADDKINQAVYKLYDLTEEEIQIIETAP